MIPVSQQTQDLASNPAVATIKSGLEQLDEFKKQKEEIMNEGMAMNDNLNAVEDLMKVNSKLVDKNSIFEKYKQ